MSTVSTVSTRAAPAAAVAVTTSAAKPQDYAGTPTVAVTTVIVRFIPIIITLVIRGLGNTATMANSIAIDPVTMPDSTVVHFHDHRGIAADVVAFVKAANPSRRRPVPL
jgi:hypothetical protein